MTVNFFHCNMSSANSAKNDATNHSEIDSRKPFPNIINEKINTEDFLAAARDVVRMIEKFGKVFAPVKYDMQGNIHKLTTKYELDKEKHSTLQDMILEEKATEEIVATDALMWLRRALHMILLFFENIINDYKDGNVTEDLVAFLRLAYKDALEPYHGWMAQQLFSLLSRMVPTRTQLLQTLVCGQIDEDELILQNLEIYLVNLKSNISVLQKFYEDHNLEDISVVQ